mmetsp:Transcript_105458/g.209585  ORF Transcript_105458/g.209585 Transcript_105458/m.209585 type:complete len:104 (-) Transcript_105458:72-383(-)
MVSVVVQTGIFKKIRCSIPRIFPAGTVTTLVHKGQQQLATRWAYAEDNAQQQAASSKQLASGEFSNMGWSHARRRLVALTPCQCSRARRTGAHAEGVPEDSLP